jgi:hypothetical protein
MDKAITINILLYTAVLSNVNNPFDKDLKILQKDYWIRLQLRSKLGIESWHGEMPPMTD